ncbi:MAG: hypothetical protein ACTSU5_04470 [Promethearchaeota archaeon]
MTGKWWIHFEGDRQGESFDKKAMCSFTVENTGETGLSGLEISVTGPFEKADSLHFSIGELEAGASHEEEVPLHIPDGEISPHLEVAEVVNTLGGGREYNPVLYPGRANNVFSLISIKNPSSGTTGKINLNKKLGNWSATTKSQPSATLGEVTLKGRAISWRIQTLEPEGVAELSLTSRIDMKKKRKGTPSIGETHVEYVIPDGGCNPFGEGGGAIEVTSVSCDGGGVKYAVGWEALEKITLREENFQVASFKASRTVKATKMNNFHTAEFTLEVNVRNNGTAVLDKLLLDEAFPTSVELPSPGEFLVHVNEEKLGEENYSVEVTPSETGTKLRIWLENMLSDIGGLKPGESVRVEFPAYVELDPEKMFEPPLTVSAVPVRNELPIEENVSRVEIGELKKTRGSGEGEAASEGDPMDGFFSFEKQILDNFSNLAVEAYNEKNFDTAIEYCNQVKELGERLGSSQLVTKFDKIIERIEKVRDFTRGAAEAGGAEKTVGGGAGKSAKKTPRGTVRKISKKASRGTVRKISKKASRGTVWKTSKKASRGKAKKSPRKKTSKPRK